MDEKRRILGGLERKRTPIRRTLSPLGTRPSSNTRPAEIQPLKGDTHRLGYLGTPSSLGLRETTCSRGRPTRKSEGLKTRRRATSEETPVPARAGIPAHVTCPVIATRFKAMVECFLFFPSPHAFENTAKRLFKTSSRVPCCTHCVWFSVVVVCNVCHPPLCRHLIPQ